MAARQFLSAPRALALATALAISVSCAGEKAPTDFDGNGNGTTGAVANIVVTISPTTINTGASTKASAVLHDASGHVLTGRTVSWSAAAPGVAAVNASTGNVTGMAEGTTDIIASSEGVTGRAALSVHAVVTSVAVSLAATSLYVGGTTTASATARDVYGQAVSGRAFTWSSTNTAVATVDANGVVTSVAPGSATIRATCEGVMGGMAMGVTQVPVASVTVTVGDASLDIGQTTPASAVLRDASNNVLSGRSVSWTSSNTSVATVSQSGTVTAVAAGNASIIATSEGVGGETGITVSAPPPPPPPPPPAPVASVSVSIASSTLIVGQTTTASAVTRDASSNVLTGRAIAWSSSNTAVAAVNASGVVTAVAAGSANIVATSEGISGQAGVTVSPPPPAPVASVSVSLASSTLIVGQTTTASAVTRDASNNLLTGRAITWSSSNTAVATVNASGTVTAVGAGSANIRATSEGVMGQAGITVAPVPVASVTVALVSSSLMQGQTTNATAVLRDASNNVLTGRAISWSSTNTAVATVNSSGLVTAVGAGSANIRATSEGVMGQAGLAVTAVPVASVTVTLASSSVPAGQTTTAAAVTRDAANNILTGRVVTWSSSNTAVATVNGSGVVTAVAIGSADITATSEGISGFATLTVTAALPGPTLVFASDWSTALGTGSSAVFDGGAWENSVDGGGPTDRMESVSAAGLDFPSGMSNVLAVLYRNNNSEYWNVNRVNGWALPPVGGSLYFRMYFRHDIAGTGGGMMHTVQTGPPGQCPYTAEWQFEKVSATEIEFVISHYGGSSSSTNGHDWTIRLAKNTTYRVEEQYVRMGTNSWKVHARVYDSNDVLIADDADFRDTWTGQTMASFTGTITSGTDCMRNKMIGNPGDGGGKGSTDTAHQHVYYGGFAVSTTGWIGPYVRGEKP